MSTLKGFGPLVLYTVNYIIAAPAQVSKSIDILLAGENHDLSKLFDEVLETRNHGTERLAQVYL